MDELELKLQVPAEHRRAVEAAIFPDAAPALNLRAIYYDTADRRLAARGLALRLRKEGGSWVQTLKVGSAGRLRRIEHNVVLGEDEAAAAGEPLLDPARHAGTPGGAALRAALGSAGGASAELLALYSTDIVRRSQWVETSDGRVEVSLDTGAITAAGQWVGVCEIELESKGGSPAALVTLARRWVLEHGLWLSTTAKSARGDRLARGAPDAPAATAEKPDVDRRMDGASLLRATLDACLRHVLANASEVAAGSTAEAPVHQLRVGIRRLRTALRELGPLAEGLDPAWEEALVGVFRQLGQLRDRETVTHGARADLVAAGAPDIELPQPDIAAPDVGHAVRAVPVQMALLGLIGFGFALEARQGGDPRRKGGRHIRRRLAKLHRQVAREGRQFDELSIDAQHRIRKRLKRLRYLSEFVAPLFPGKAVDRYLKALRPAQEELGLRNDATVALDVYRDAAAHDPQAWFAVGWLSAQREGSARRCRKSLAAIESAERFWKR